MQVEEIWSLDPDSFKNLEPIHGLIFLFKWVQDDEPAGSIVQDNRLEKIFFAKQVINNACATQAILSTLLNCSHEDVSLGPTLINFKVSIVSTHKTLLNTNLNLRNSVNFLILTTKD